MRYVANPVVVDAFVITKVIPGTDEVPMVLHLDNGKIVSPSAGMLARMTPVAGDYWVIQEDDYAYLNPKAIFLRKYREERRAGTRLKMEGVGVITNLSSVIRQFLEATMDVNSEKVAAAHEAAKKLGF